MKRQLCTFALAAILSAQGCSGGLVLYVAEADAGGAADGAGGTATDAGAGGDSEAASLCPGIGGPAMVWLPWGFCIDSTEVSRKQYEQWLSTNPQVGAEDSRCSWNTDLTPHPECLADSCNHASCGDDPQVCLDWCDAFAYCRSVGKRLCGKIGGGANGFYDYAKAGISQWFYACTSAGLHNFPYGGDPEKGKFDGYDPYVCNGGELMSSAAGVQTFPDCQSSEPGFTAVFDLSGNVEEWEDSCESEAPDGYCHYRGGSYAPLWGIPEGLSCASPNNAIRDTRRASLGFRCCADP